MRAFPPESAPQAELCSRIVARSTPKLMTRMHRLRTFSIGLVAVLSSTAGAAAPQADDLPGMPPLLERQDVYAGARPGRLSPDVKGFPDRVYVPNSVRNTVQVI